MIRSQAAPAIEDPESIEDHEQEGGKRRGIDLPSLSEVW